MLIGVTGFAQHGKDSTGQVLAERYGFKRYAFADQLKSMALALNPIVQSYPFPRHPQRLRGVVGFLGWEKAKEIGEVRRFLQVLGTEGVREHVGEDAWIEALELVLKKDGQADRQGIAYGAKVVVTDVRFPNEADWIHRRGGYLWRVNRLEKTEDFYKPFDNGIGREHPSERYIADLNDDRRLIASNLDELSEEVERAWTNLMIDTGLKSWSPKKTG